MSEFASKKLSELQTLHSKLKYQLDRLEKVCQSLCNEVGVRVRGWGSYSPAHSIHFLFLTFSSHPFSFSLSHAHPFDTLLPSPRLPPLSSFLVSVGIQSRGKRAE